MKFLHPRIFSAVAAAALPLFVAGVSELALASGFPDRPVAAITGSAFARQTNGMRSADRERAVLVELRRGNVPSFLRQPVPVSLQWRDVHGAEHTGVIEVLPDYLAIGSDSDFIRIPMTPITAQLVADEFGFILPTPKLVDEINRQADVHLVPTPMPVRGAQMTKSDVFLKHNRIIESQRRGRGTGKLISGHKKDVVITNRLAGHPNQVAIYGWHRANGKPIQPLSLVHESTYADYSHGIRLVSRHMVVDGVLLGTEEALRGDKTCRALSYEGKMRVTRARTTGLAPSRSYLASKRRGGKAPRARLAKSKGSRGRLVKAIAKPRHAGGTAKRLAKHGKAGKRSPTTFVKSGKKRGKAMPHQGGAMRPVSATAQDKAAFKEY